MSDSAVIVPTSLGPVGGVVSEPSGPVRAAMILLQGGARGGRAGVNAVWTRTARRLAELDVAVLRVDYAGDGESFMVVREQGVRGKYETDRQIVVEAARWFRERAGAPELHVAGSCYGGTLAIALAAADAATTQLFLVVPYLRRFSDGPGWGERLRRVRRGVSPGTADDVRLAPELIETFADVSARASTWILLGEKDPPEAFEVERNLAQRGTSIDIDVVPGMALYPVHYPDIQEEVQARLVARVEQALRVAR
jgi:hypothetical protein